MARIPIWQSKNFCDPGHTPVGHSIFINSPTPQNWPRLALLLILGLISAEVLTGSPVAAQPRRRQMLQGPPPGFAPYPGPVLAQPPLQMLPPGAPPPGTAIPVYPGPPGLPVPPVPDSLAQPVANVVPAELYRGDIHFEVSQALLQLLVGRQDVSSGAVQDFVSGAMVNGQQTTQSNLSLVCVPSAQGAQFDFLVDGLIQSATVATTPQANIQQQGNTLFQARKRVFLDGEKVLTQRVNVQVLPNQVVTGARLNQQLPFFSQLGDRIAYRAAVARSAESNMLAGQRTIERLQPELDRKIDASLFEWNTKFRGLVWDRLQEWNVQPAEKMAFSTSDRLFWDYRLGTNPIAWTAPAAQVEQPEITAGPVTGVPVTGVPVTQRRSDISLHLHDSLFEEVARRRQLGGKTISLNELRSATDRFLKLFAEDVSEQLPELPIAVNFTFDQSRPLQGSYQNDELILILRGVFQAGSLPKTNTQQIRLRVKTTFKADTLTLAVQDVQVRELDAAGNPEEPGLTQTAIAAQLRTQLSPLKLKRTLPIPTGGTAPLVIEVSQMTTRDGWLEIELNRVNSATVPGSPLPGQWQPGTTPAGVAPPSFSAPSIQPIPDPGTSPMPVIIGPAFPTGN